ncbi:hypothetical protein VIGAN_09193400, partial [Vigna angularis var. angularis]
FSSNKKFDPKLKTFEARFREAERNAKRIPFFLCENADSMDQTAGLKLQKGLIEGRESSKRTLQTNPTLFPVRGFSRRTSAILKMTTATKKKHHVDPLNPLIRMMNSGRLGLVLAKIAPSITRC